MCTVPPAFARPVMRISQSRMFTSMHSILHSLRPSKLLNHSMPNPVHSALRRESSSAAAPANAVAVVFNISKAVSLKVWSLCATAVQFSVHSKYDDRGANQLLLKSKKQRSDQ